MQHLTVPVFQLVPRPGGPHRRAQPCRSQAAVQEAPARISGPKPSPPHSPPRAAEPPSVGALGWPQGARRAQRVPSASIHIPRTSGDAPRLQAVGLDGL